MILTFQENDTMSRKLVVFLPLLFSLLPAAGQSVAQLMQKGQEQVEAYEEKDALKVFQQVLQKDPENLAALTEASFLSSKIGNRTEGEERAQLYKQARAYAAKALAIDSNSAKANYVMGVAMGRIALISPTREKLEASKDVKKYSERALRIKRDYPEAWHLLGRWHMGVKDLGATKMFLIKVIYGGMPSASYESAASCFNRAINLRPDYILYYLDLAKAYVALGRNEDAKAVLGKALAKTPKTPDDPGHLEACRKMLEELQ